MCLENNWSYDKIEDVIRATCQMCSYEVEFKARERKINKNYKQEWVRFENDGETTRMFDERYPDGIYVRLLKNVNWKKRSPIDRFHKKPNIFQHIIDLK